MKIDIIDILRLHSGIAQGILHHQTCAQPLGVGSSDVVSIGAEAAACHLGIDFRTAGLCVLKLFEHKGCGALADYEAVARAAERA